MCQATLRAQSNWRICRWIRNKTKVSMLEIRKKKRRKKTKPVFPSTFHDCYYIFYCYNNRGVWVKVVVLRVVLFGSTNMHAYLDRLSSSHRFYRFDNRRGGIDRTERTLREYTTSSVWRGKTVLGRMDTMWMAKFLISLNIQHDCVCVRSNRRQNNSISRKWTWKSDYIIENWWVNWNIAWRRNTYSKSKLSSI